MPPDTTTQERMPVRTEVKLGEDSFFSDDFLRQLMIAEAEINALNHGATGRSGAAAMGGGR